jgi:hypothetical protein
MPGFIKRYWCEVLYSGLSLLVGIFVAMMAPLQPLISGTLTTLDYVIHWSVYVFGALLATRLVIFCLQLLFEGVEN